MKTIRFNAEAYAEVLAVFHRLHREATINAPHAIIRELADLMDVECRDQFNAAIARGFARWVGCQAKHVGKTRREAIEACASEFHTFKLVERNALRGDKRSMARYQARRLAMRAWANGRTINEQRAHERNEQERIMLVGRARSDKPFARTIIARRARERGNHWLSVAWI